MTVMTHVRSNVLQCYLNMCLNGWDKNQGKSDFLCTSIYINMVNINKLTFKE